MFTVDQKVEWSCCTHKLRMTEILNKVWKLFVFAVMIGSKICGACYHRLNKETRGSLIPHFLPQSGGERCVRSPPAWWQQGYPPERRRWFIKASMAISTFRPQSRYRLWSSWIRWSILDLGCCLNSVPAGALGALTIRAACVTAACSSSELEEVSLPDPRSSPASSSKSCCCRSTGSQAHRPLRLKGLQLWHLPSSFPIWLRSGWRILVVCAPACCSALSRDLQVNPWNRFSTDFMRPVWPPKISLSGMEAPNFARKLSKVALHEWLEILQSSGKPPFLSRIILTHLLNFLCWVVELLLFLRHPVLASKVHPTQIDHPTVVWAPTKFWPSCPAPLPALDQLLPWFHLSRHSLSWSWTLLILSSTKTGSLGSGSNHHLVSVLHVHPPWPGVDRHQRRTTDQSIPKKADLSCKTLCKIASCSTVKGSDCFNTLSKHKPATRKFSHAQSVHAKIQLRS